MSHFPAGHDDDVETRLRLVMAEYFAGQALGTVSDDRGPDLSGCRNPKPRVFSVV